MLRQCFFPSSVVVWEDVTATVPPTWCESECPMGEGGLGTARRRLEAFPGVHLQVHPFHRGACQHSAAGAGGGRKVGRRRRPCRDVASSNCPSEVGRPSAVSRPSGRPLAFRQGDSSTSSRGSVLRWTGAPRTTRCDATCTHARSEDARRACPCATLPWSLRAGGVLQESAPAPRRSLHSLPARARLSHAGPPPASRRGGPGAHASSRAHARATPSTFTCARPARRSLAPVADGAASARARCCRRARRSVLDHAWPLTVRRLGRRVGRGESASTA